MRAAPRPTNSSTNSLAVQEKKGTPASPATARASSVLPARAARQLLAPKHKVTPLLGQHDSPQAA